VRFYTLPPISVCWNFILVNANKPSFSYLKRWGKVKSIILDCGVEVFRDPSVKDYPKYHLNRLVSLYRKLTKYAEEVYAVAPDYPDDYHPKNLWVDGKTNIERTVESVAEAVDRFSEVNWLIPIQGHNEDPLSVAKCIEMYEDLGLTKRFNYFAVANLCVSKKVDTIVKTVNVARFYLPNKRLHAFGISLSAAKKLRNILFSFDSLAYTFPRERGLWSCKNREERERYFKQYVERLIEGDAVKCG